MLLTSTQDKMVTVASFHESQQAEIYRSILESSGIKCIILDSHVNQVYGNAVAYTSGVRLQVFQSQAEDALRLLSEAGVETVTDPQEHNMLLLFLLRISNRIPIISQYSAPYRALIALIILALGLFGLLFAFSYVASSNISDADYKVKPVTYQSQAA